MTTLTTILEVVNQALGHIGVAEEVTSLTADTAKEDRACNRFYLQALDELLELNPWSHAIEHRALVLTARYAEHNTDYVYTAQVITGITAANPAVVTIASHPYSDGDHIRIYEVAGMTQVNRSEPYHISEKAANTFELTGIDSTNWTAYTSGGKAVREQPHPDYSDGLTYELPSNFGQAISLYGTDANFIIKDSKLLTHEDPAILIYIRNDLGTDAGVAKMKALFINLWSLRLALKIALPIIGVSKESLEIIKLLHLEYAQARREAVTMARMEIRRQAPTDDPALAAMGYGQAGSQSAWPRKRQLLVD